MRIYFCLMIPVLRLLLQLLYIPSIMTLFAKLCCSNVRSPFILVVVQR